MVKRTVLSEQAAYLRDGTAIYERSFAIIRAEADLSRFSAEEADVAVRMIHACGAVEAAQHIVFGPDLVAAARRKLERKRCDLVVANDVTRAGAGFDGDTNAVSFVWPGGEVEELPLASKREVAERLLDRVEKLREAQR